MILALIIGLLISFIGSMIPTGPIALIVLKHGLGRQKLSALCLVSGAALAEAGYAMLAYLGINFALSRYPLHINKPVIKARIIKIDNRLKFRETYGQRQLYELVSPMRYPAS